MNRRGRTTKRLAPDDAAIWKRVAESVSPLAVDHPLTTPGLSLPPEDVPQMAKAAPPPIPAPARRVSRVNGVETIPHLPKAPTDIGRLDARTVRRIARGRTSIDARIDLHGMTRGDAHERLLNFLAMSQALGRRTVLVITGKGFAGEGVLRREVPLWLATPAFRPMIVGVDEASASHGGAGALYVRLKRSS